MRHSLPRSWQVGHIEHEGADRPQASSALMYTLGLMSSFEVTGAAGGDWTPGILQTTYWQVVYVARACMHSAMWSG